MNYRKNMCRRFFFVTCLLLAAAPSIAQQPSWAGGGKEAKGGKGPDQELRGGGRGRGSESERGQQRNQNNDGGLALSLRFTAEQRTRLHTYYGDQVRSGHCPPGLAKKNNGCQPPGQAKQWALGRPLSSDVVMRELEPEIAIHLGMPPAGHRFVRVASDILLIAVGTSMVLDAIEDLGSL